MTNATVPLPTRPGRPERARASRRRRRRGWGAALLVLVVAGGGGAWAWWNGSVGPVTVRERCTAVASGSSTSLDPGQAGNAAIIAGIANQRGLPARATSIGIATAIQESKLRNISYGDRDSLGLFQQRPSQGWGTQKQILDPVYSTNAFYDVLAKVDGFETMPITEVAQAVQNSAFPNAYADHEPEARIIASALSGYSPGGFNCVLRQPKVTPQTPGTDGLTRRARDVRTAAGRETGLGQAVAVGASGTQLSFTVAEQAGNRTAWSLGQWAVARAGALQVTGVQVGDQQWRRSASQDGWTTASTALTSGKVQITVA